MTNFARVAIAAIVLVAGFSSGVYAQEAQKDYTNEIAVFERGYCGSPGLPFNEGAWCYSWTSSLYGRDWTDDKLIRAFLRIMRHEKP